MKEWHTATVTKGPSDQELSLEKARIKIINLEIKRERLAATVKAKEEPIDYHL